MNNWYFENYVRPETRKRQERAKAAAKKVFNIMFASVGKYNDFDMIKDLCRKPTYYEQWQCQAAKRTK